MATLTWRGYATNTDGSAPDSTPTFSVDIGSAASDRWVIVCIVGREPNIGAVTVNGTTLPNTQNNGGGQHPVYFAWGLVTSGSGTVTVAVNTGGTPSASWAMSGCWTVTGGGANTLTKRDADGGVMNGVYTTVGSFTLTTAVGDYVFGGTNCLNAGSNARVTWSQGTERSDFDFGTQSYSVMDFVADGSTEAVQATHAEGVTNPSVTDLVLYLASAPYVPPTPPDIFDIRLVAYEPNGSRLGLMPYPSSINASFVNNDVGALDLTYSSLVAGGSLLSRGLVDGLEIALEVWNPTTDTWTEPWNARFLLIKRSQDTSAEDGAAQLTLPSYAWLLRKACNVETANLLPPDSSEAGKRPFYSDNAGTILDTLMQENATRGGVTLTNDFTTTVDSASAAWTKEVTIYYEFGMDLWTILSNLTDQGVLDWRTAARVLRGWNPDTATSTDRSVGLAPVRLMLGRDVADAPEEESLEEVASRVTITGDNGFYLTEDNPSAPTPWGEWEAVISHGGVTDTGTATSLVQRELERRGRVRGQYTRALTPETMKFLPLIDFAPGEWIKAPGSRGVEDRLRVQQITLTRDAAGRVAGNVVLNDRILDAQLRLAKRVTGIVGGSTAGGGSGAEPTTGNDVRQPAQVLGLVVDSLAYFVNGQPFGLVEAGWTAVTTASDGTAQEIASYEFWGRRDVTDAPWIMLTTATTTVIEVSGFTPGEDWLFKVRAIAAVSPTPGIFSADYAHTVAVDTTPPSTPSTPVPTVNLGQVILAWDGLDNSALPMPTDFDYVEVHQSTTNGFTADATTLVGRLDGADVMVMPEQTYDVPYYYRLKAVDTSGNKGTQSAQATATTTKIVESDLAQALIDAINAGSNLWLIYQDTQPVGTDFAVDTVWFDTDDGYKPYRWTGASWVAVPWGSSALADGSVVLGKLAAGSVSTAALQAGAATFEKVALGDLSNFCEVNESYELATLGSHGHQIETLSNVRWSRRDDNSGTEFYFRNKKGPIPFIVGDRLRVRFTAFSDSSTAAAVWLHTYLADGTYITSQQLGDGFTITTTATEFAVEEAVETATMANAAQFIIGLAGLTANRNVRLRNARAHQMNAGELLVDGAVKANMVESLAIQTAHLAAGAVDATKLAALLILVGKIASAQSGRRWEADQYGIRLFETDGSMLINLPTDPNTPAVFKGNVVATSLTVLDQFLLRGLMNSIATNAKLTLAAGTTAPGSPPQVVAGWDIMAITPPFVPGSSYDPHMHGWVRDGSYYYTAQTGLDGSAYIFRYSATTLARDAGWSISLALWHPDGGVTVLGTDVYALGRNEHGTTWKVVRYTISTQAYVGQFDVTASLTDFQSGYWQALGNDGTNLMVAYRTTADGVKIRKFSTGGTPGSTITTDIDWSDHYYWHPTAVMYGNFDFGASRYVVAIENREDAVQDPMPYVLHDGGAGTWVNDTAEQWEIPGQTHGMCWDSTLSKFVRLDYSAVQVTKYTSLVWSTESNVWWASTTWYDSNVTGGYHETDQGPRTQFTMLKRAALTLISPPIPPRPTPNTNDDVMRPRFYLGRGATDPTRTGMYLQTEVADGVIVLTPSSPTFSGTNPPASNNFPSAGPATLQAADPSKFKVLGDGTGNWGSITVGTTKTTIGTHVLRASALDTSSVSAGWTDLDWTGTTTVNEDSWTLSADGLYWTCPLAGTYSVFVRINCSGTTAMRVEMDAESTADGTVRVMGIANHDYVCASIPAVRMSVNDRIKVGFDPGGSNTVLDTSLLLVTRLG